MASVTTEITQILFPSISGYSQATVALDGNSAETYDLGQIENTQGPSVSIQEGSENRTEITACVLNSSGNCIASTTVWVYYELINNGSEYEFRKSDTETGTSEAFAEVPTTSDGGGSLRAVFEAGGGGEVIIVLGDFVINSNAGAFGQDGFELSTD